MRNFIIAFVLILLAGNDAFAMSLESRVTTFVSFVEKESAARKCNISVRESEIKTAVDSKQLRIVEVTAFNLDSALEPALICSSATKTNFIAHVFEGLFCRNSNTIFVNKVPVSYINSHRVITHEYEHYLNGTKFKLLLGEHPLDLVVKLREEAETTSKTGKWPKGLFRQMANVQFLYIWDEARAFLKEYGCTQINWAVSEREFVLNEISPYIQMVSGKLKIPSYAADLVYALAARYSDPAMVQDDDLFNSFLDSILEQNKKVLED